MYALVIYNNISSFQVPVYYMTVLKNRRKRNFKKISQISISLYTYLPDSSVKSRVGMSSRPVRLGTEHRRGVWGRPGHWGRCNSRGQCPPRPVRCLPRLLVPLGCGQWSPHNPDKTKWLCIEPITLNIFYKSSPPKNYAEFSDEIDALDLFSKYLSLLGDETNNCVIFNKFSFSNLRVFTLT